jgi:AcrR family transcriptional regulator
LPASQEITPPTRRIDIGRIRREQIVEAAAGIIVRQGLPSLSLSKIERAAGMKRGQLTYYFPTKEDILLAVFDRLLLLMYQQLERAGLACQEGGANHTCWECVQQLLHAVLGPEPFGPEFHTLQYTFLAQIAHREDFRKRLASLYEEWRNGLALHWKATARPVSPLAGVVSPRGLASFVQALVHGLLVQRAADPKAFDRTEMLALCVGVLAPLFTGGEAGSAHPLRNGHARRRKEKAHG